MVQFLSFSAFDLLVTSSSFPFYLRYCCPKVSFHLYPGLLIAHSEPLLFIPVSIFTVCKVFNYTFLLYIFRLANVKIRAVNIRNVMSLWCYLFAVLSPIPCSRYTSVTLTFSISEMMDYALDESPANITAGPACIWAIADTRIAHILRRKLVFIQSCGGFTCCHCSTWI